MQAAIQSQPSIADETDHEINELFGQSEAEDEVFVRSKPGTLNKLIKATKFSRHEIFMLYQGFKQECPSGVVTEDAFKMIFAQFFPQGDSSRYAHFVFKTFKQTTGTKARLNFEQFVGMLSSLSRGTPVEKLRWVFNLYDIEGDGKISRQEMLTIVSSIYDLMGHSTRPRVDQETATTHVDQMFVQMDTNQDGVITFDEFCDWCQKDANRAQNLLMFDTVLM